MELNVISDSRDPIIDTIHYNNVSFQIWKSLTYNIYYTIVCGKYIKICDVDEPYKQYVIDIIDYYTNKLIDIDEDSYLA